MLGFLFAIFGGAFLTLMLIPFTMGMLSENGLQRPNYRGEQIPVCMGISFLIGTLFAAAIGLVFAAGFPQREFLWMIALLGMGFLGLVDDLVGSRADSGLRGHFRKLFKERKLSTGALKALGGGAVALFASLIMDRWGFQVVLDTLMIALMTNTINLLDLRPGRAIKGYLFFFLLFVIFARPRSEFIFLVLPLTVNAILYFPSDLKAKSMMGDVGSNTLGVGLGLAALWFLPALYRMILLLVLIALHIYTEKYSLSKTIEGNRVLRMIDQWGR